EELYTKALGAFVESIGPWFFEFGSWIFGGLVAFTLLILAPLITLGPVDHAIMVATAVFALALPLDVAGVFLLRLAQDLPRVGFDENLAQAFQEVGSVMAAPTPSSSALESQQKRRSERVLRTSLSLLTLSGLLALIGMLAVLWHIAWWIAVAFFAMVVLSLLIVSITLATAQPRNREAFQEQRRRYQEQRKHARDARRQQAQPHADPRTSISDEH